MQLFEGKYKEKLKDARFADATEGMPEELDADFPFIASEVLMGRAAAAFSNFTAGELSPRLDGRTDLKKYFNGCKRTY